MLASSFFDLVLGLDIHFEMVPTPAPLPLPIPNPFTGIIFDPMGLAAGLVLGNLMAAVSGAPPTGPVVYWGFVPATNTGTEAIHIPGHILFPPGVAWAPFPKTPKPVIHPGEVPAPALPIKPENDAICVFGSKTVTVMGSNAVRFGDILLSCSEPIRLPSSVVLAIPKGAPILIGGPPSLDLMSAVMASLRTRFVSDSLHALVSRLRPSRFRNFLHRAVCFFTGHPVDVASGKVLTEAVDAELGGPMPFRVERIYSSACASRRGPLGHGWSLSLDQAIWTERGKVVLLAEDGREIEFDTFDHPGHTMLPGEAVYHPIERLSLRCLGGSRWEVEARDGTVREFAPVPGRPEARAALQRIRSRCRNHEIVLAYDARGRLEWVRDSAGRLVWLEHDDEDRLVALNLPLPRGRGFAAHRQYRYDDQGDLVAVSDALGHEWRFEYVTHLLVRETDRNGLSFYFAYDGLGEDAFCVRTWGDGGIYDHRLQYDKRGRVTVVTDSLGNTTRYYMNVVGLVTKIVDPLGGTTEYQVDPTTLQRTREVDPAGVAVERRYDDRGNLIELADGVGSKVRLEYDRGGRPVRAVDALGGEWRWEYDENGSLVRRVNPLGEATYLTWDRGLLVALALPDRRKIHVEYDEHKEIREIRSGGSGKSTYERDERGRLIAARDPRGAVVTTAYDAEGRTLERRSRSGAAERHRYDPEGHLVEIDSDARRIKLEYGHFHRLVRRSEGGGEISFHYDSEGHLLAARNEYGEQYLFTYDASGNVATETRFSGGTWRYRRDAAGRVGAAVDPAGSTSTMTYDAAGRLARVDHGDGTFLEFRYRADGELEWAQNEHSETSCHRDAIGRILAEVQPAGRVASTYLPGGARHRIESSLGARCTIVHDAGLGARELHLGGGASPEAVIAFTRDPMGAELSRLLPGGVELQWDRDIAGRPLARRTTRVDSGAARLDARAYEWRGEDQIAAIVDAARGARTFEHDRAGRLLSERSPRGDVARPLRRFSADELAEERASARFGPGSRVIDHAGVRYTYDAAGRLQTKERDGRRWSFHWNGHGLLRRVELPDGRAALFEYDAFARRTAKRIVRCGSSGEEVVDSETRFLWDGHTLLHEISIKHGLTTWYWEPGLFAPVARERGGQVWSVIPDHLGAPTTLFDTSGVQVWAAETDTLGRTAVEQGAPEDCPWRWPGQYEDPETGLYYNRFRYYDPDAGNYVSPDPLGLLAGTAEYAYAPDSLVWFDPLGLIVLQQVPYNDHPLFGAVSEFIQGKSRSDLRGRNVAAVLLDDGTVIVRASEGGGNHAERVLMGLSEVDPAKVVAVYTERSPCTGRINCHDLLDSSLGADVPVYYTHEMIRGQEGKTAQQIEADRNQFCRGG
ncbi:conserved carbohydrate-binding protein, Rhs family [Sorangium cellulosum So ce56]|uniref:Conserved carbohydrate-binding protein, Rhs family n=1 Tax=Sorangium cellulosum (strain So ce56) TaxID=448385 RepID=A9EVR3_SORC5|nr:nucleic acid/nucleotide deaminase domain-containing protein [Sorangium cellulosum]CAN94249.1 conserved carbohydrate-binding protein, Rhs family [Sorangium cellulosum So ce56]